MARLSYVLRHLLRYLGVEAVNFLCFIGLFGRLRHDTRRRFWKAVGLWPEEWS